IVTFGVALYTQQVLSRAAADGALALSSQSRSFQPSDIREVVFASLARSLVVPAGAGRLGDAERLAWVRNEVSVDVPPGSAGAGSLVLRVTYPYERNAVLPSLPIVGLLIPADLVGQAT